MAEAGGQINKSVPFFLSKVLHRLAVINNYLEENPEAATALAWGMAAMQGPKAVIQLAAEQALEATDLGQRFTEYVAGLQYELGKYVAEKMEGKDLFEEEIKDKLLIGGGNLLVSIISGGMPVGRTGGAGSRVVKVKESSSPAKNHNPHSGQTDAEAGLPYGGAHPETSVINYDKISTAKPHQATSPRDLNEQALWNRVLADPASARDTKLAGDTRFPRAEGWVKMEATHKLPDGANITIHYQYNSFTGKAYDMKIVTPQRTSPLLQPGVSLGD